MIAALTHYAKNWAFLGLVFWQNGAPQEAMLLTSTPLSHWEMSSAIVRDARLRDSLDLIPQQSAQIQAMRSSSEFAEKFEKTAGELRAKLEPKQRQAADVFNRALWEYDEEVRQALGGILEPEQLNALRPKYLESKFSAGWMPFRDTAVAEFCGISRSELRGLAPILGTEKKRYQERFSELRRLAGQRVLKELGDTAQHRFVQYAGSLCLPHIALDPEFNSGIIPYPSSFLSGGHIMRIMRSPELQTTLQVSQEQLNRLSVIEEQRSQKLRAYSRRKGLDSFPAYFKTTMAVAEKEIASVLSQSQRINISRTSAQADFLNDFSAPFKRKDLVKYLALSEQDAERMAKTAESVRADLRDAVRELNRTQFETIASTLQESKRTAISGLFLGVWK